MTQLQDGLVQSDEYAVRLPIFEGPLDLLLFLIRKNEIDIYDIPIETVTRQYLGVLYGMEELQLEVAGEFFVMAATLMQIKSRLLLPRDEQPAEEDEGGEGTDPRWELVQQLIEYRRFKEAGEELGRRAAFVAEQLPRLVRTEDQAQPERPLQPVDRIDIWNTFNQILRRLADRIVVGEIHAETVTVADRMEDILQLLRVRRSFRFTELWTREKHSLQYVVASFLALLELTRLSWLRLEQDEAFADIRCTACEINETPQPPTNNDQT